MQTLGVLDVDGLDEAVQLLLGVLLVVSPPRDADAESVGNALDTGLPHLLVQLGVQADIGGALKNVMSAFQSHHESRNKKTFQRSDDRFEIVDVVVGIESMGEIGRGSVP